MLIEKELKNKRKNEHHVKIHLFSFADEKA